MSIKEEALEYHSKGRPGKIEVVSTKPCATQRDLSLAYTPGVATPCLEIEKNPADAYKYTAKGNLVAVVSNGTAVLGLGNIGALAGKPVMEGKGVLFKRFADVDVFDIELATEDPDEIIKVCKLLEPTFGGINLEDIKAPECFYIEETLKKEMGIPVFHDDQHGTAVISGAGLINALEMIGKDISKIRLVVSGAGAAGIACANLYIAMGVKRENILMGDSKGIIYEGRGDKFNKYKAAFARKTDCRTLADALKDADVFVGVSQKNLVTKEMVKSMAKDPIIFAMANPDPEITYEDAVDARKDVIMATGRSDYPNQINNVLGFPFIFRGALDSFATAINEDMKMAASKALAALAKEDVPDAVSRAYGGSKIAFGREYVIPKPFDPRVLLWEASAVAAADMKSGVARKTFDIEEYKEKLEARLGAGRAFIRQVKTRAKKNLKRIVFPEAGADKIMRAVNIIREEGIAEPILLGDATLVKKGAAEVGVNCDGLTIINPIDSPLRDEYAKALYEKRMRKGVSFPAARWLMRDRGYFGTMMVEMGHAEVFLTGATQPFPTAIRPALEIIDMKEGMTRVYGLMLMVLKNKLYFFADTAMNIEPTAEELAQIAECSAREARNFGVEPRIAMLSFSNFGSVRHPKSAVVRQATEIVRKRNPGLVIEGEMHADVAVTPELLLENFPFSTLKEEANVLIFPTLDAGNIAYKLVERLGGATAIGPIMLGLKKSIHILLRTHDVNDIVNIAAIAAVEAECK
ncbi:MAG: NADP-dependent malic enzyme [candidate division Zixibacteria bacterium]|nr:NADP-dependent malic enzyme [candidate division Zixibacteria bacterium]